MTYKANTVQIPPQVEFEPTSTEGVGFGLYKKLVAVDLYQSNLRG